MFITAQKMNKFSTWPNNLVHPSDRTVVGFSQVLTQLPEWMLARVLLEVNTNMPTATQLTKTWLKTNITLTTPPPVTNEEYGLYVEAYFNQTKYSVPLKNVIVKSPTEPWYIRQHFVYDVAPWYQMMRSILMKDEQEEEDPRLKLYMSIVGKCAQAWSSKIRPTAIGAIIQQPCDVSQNERRFQNMAQKIQSGQHVDINEFNQALTVLMFHDAQNVHFHPKYLNLLRGIMFWLTQLTTVVGKMRCDTEQEISQCLTLIVLVALFKQYYIMFGDLLKVNEMEPHHTSFLYSQLNTDTRTITWKIMTECLIDMATMFNMSEINKLKYEVDGAICAKLSKYITYISVDGPPTTKSIEEQNVFIQNIMKIGIPRDGLIWMAFLMEHGTCLEPLTHAHNKHLLVNLRRCGVQTIVFEPACWKQNETFIQSENAKRLLTYELLQTSQDVQRFIATLPTITAPNNSDHVFEAMLSNCIQTYRTEPYTVLRNGSTSCSLRTCIFPQPQDIKYTETLFFKWLLDTRRPIERVTPAARGPSESISERNKSIDTFVPTKPIVSTPSVQPGTLLSVDVEMEDDDIVPSVRPTSTPMLVPAAQSTFSSASAVGTEKLSPRQVLFNKTAQLLELCQKTSVNASVLRKTVAEYYALMLYRLDCLYPNLKNHSKMFQPTTNVVNEPKPNFSKPYETVFTHRVWGVTIEVGKGNIAKCTGFDAIVNAANTSFTLVGAGVTGSIKSHLGMAGLFVDEETKKTMIGGSYVYPGRAVRVNICPRGQPKRTDYNYIIHAMGLPLADARDWNDEDTFIPKQFMMEILYECCFPQNLIRSVCVPLVGGEIFKNPPLKVISAMLMSLRYHLYYLRSALSPNFKIAFCLNPGYIPETINMISHYFSDQLMSMDIPIETLAQLYNELPARPFSDEKGYHSTSSSSK